jgi:hypothetical protein
MTQFSPVNPVNNFDSTVKNDEKWAEPDLNRRPLVRKAPELAFEDQNELLERFKDFQMVDLRKSKRTAYEKVWFIKRLFQLLTKTQMASAEMTSEVS